MDELESLGIIGEYVQGKKRKVLDLSNLKLLCSHFVINLGKR